MEIGANRGIMASKVAIGVGIVAAIAVFAAAGFLAGHFTHPCKYRSEPVHVYNHAPGPCHLVDGIDIGAEDIVVLPSGRAIMTSPVGSTFGREEFHIHATISKDGGLRVWVDVTKPPYKGRQGGMKIFDFNQPDNGAKDLTIQYTSETFELEKFNPHGLSVWDDSAASGKVYVFVINHGHPDDLKEAVEKFELNEDMYTLILVERIMDDAHLLYLNNLIATGPDTFFYNNIFASRKMEDQIKDAASKAATGSVGYYDGQRGRIVVTDMVTPNGINISPDGRYVYVAQYELGLVVTFRRNNDNSLEWQQNNYACRGIDNIDVSGDYLWLACHPDHDQLVKHLADPEEEISPSQALRLTMKDGDVIDMVEVFSNNGSLFSASTVAVRYKEATLMGSVSKNALYCEARYIG